MAAVPTGFVIGCDVSPPKTQRVAAGATLEIGFTPALKRGLDLEAPSFQKGLRDVFGVLVAACPLPQTRRPQILVGGELVFAHNLLEFGDSWGNWPDRFGLAPVRISASLGHELLPFHSRGMKLQNRLSI